MARRTPRSRGAVATVEELISSLSTAELCDVARSAAGRHDDVEREIRLVAARSSGDLALLRAEVDRGLRTRRFLDYRASLAWAQAARLVLAELEAVSRSTPTSELVELVQRALGHVVKVLQHADDSSGALGDVARELLELHASTCDAGVADPVKLARWMIRFRFVDQDFFEADVVRYRVALGDQGIAAYRDAVTASEDRDSFAVRYARERLAVLDGDTEQIVTLLGGDLHSPHQFLRVAEAMAELGLTGEVLDWTARGIAETTGWQTAALYDLACATHVQRGEPLDALRLRRAQHERAPSRSTYAALRSVADTLDAWPLERDAARAALRAHDTSGFVDAVLSDGAHALAWQTATDAPKDTIGPEQWLRLAEAREPHDPADALAVYEQVARHVLLTADRRAYQQAVRILKRGVIAARAADKHDEFAADLADLRERHRRRPTLIALLDKANLP